jgi:hypothetical protein
MALLLALLWIPITVTFDLGRTLTRSGDLLPLLGCWVPEMLLLASIFAPVRAYSQLIVDGLDWHLRAAGASRLAVTWPAAVFGIVLWLASSWASDRVVPAAKQALALSAQPPGPRMFPIDDRDPRVLVFREASRFLLVADAASRELDKVRLLRPALLFELGGGIGGVYYHDETPQRAVESAMVPSEKITETGSGVSCHVLSAEQGTLEAGSYGGTVVFRFSEIGGMGTIFVDLETNAICVSHLDRAGLARHEAALTAGWRNSVVTVKTRVGEDPGLLAQVNEIFARARRMPSVERYKRLSVSFGCLCLALAGCRLAFVGPPAYRLPMNMLFGSLFLGFHLALTRLSVKLTQPYFFEPKVVLWIMNVLLLGFVAVPPKSWWLQRWSRRKTVPSSVQGQKLGRS